MKKLLMLAPFFFAGAAYAADSSVVTSLMLKDLPDVAGKEALVISVVYPPGSSNPVHRHNAHSFIYVIEGAVVMQLRGGEPVTLTAGQTFYEGPDDIHIVGRNASLTKPAKLLVVLIKEKGADVVIPAH